jgi:hypothetical protein
MSEQPDFRISFVTSDAAESQDLANDLGDFLATEIPAARAERERADPLAQDFGATLAVILGTTAVTALARGIAAWLARRQDARMRLRRVMPDGSMRELTIDGQVGGRAQELVSDFFTD